MNSEKGFYWCYHMWRYCNKNCQQCDKLTEEEKQNKDEFYIGDTNGEQNEA